jgi:hypothetical protein
VLLRFRSRYVLLSYFRVRGVIIYSHSQEFSINIDLLLASGLDSVRDAYKDGDCNTISCLWEMDYDGGWKDYLSYPLGRILERRKIQTVTDPDGYWTSILKNVVGASDSCKRRKHFFLTQRLRLSRYWMHENWRKFLMGFIEYVPFSFSPVIT